MSGIVIVEVGPDDRTLVEQLLDPRAPFLHVLAAVEDELLPRFGLLLDALPVADEADVGPVGREHVELGHPKEIEQDQGDAAAPEEVVEFRREPALVADFQGELEALGERRKELLERLELVGLEVVGELEHQGSPLGAEEVHHPEEFLELGLAIDQALLVGDHAGDLGRKDEALGGVALPLADHGLARGAVPGGVDLDGVEAPRVMGEEFSGLGLSGIEGAAPGVRGPAGGADAQPFLVHGVAAYSRIRILQCLPESSNAADGS